MNSILALISGLGLGLEALGLGLGLETPGLVNIPDEWLLTAAGEALTTGHKTSTKLHCAGNRTKSIIITHID